MPGYGPRVMWGVLGLTTMAVDAAAPHRPAFAQKRVTPPRIPCTLTRSTALAQPHAPAPPGNVSGGDVDAPRARSPSPVAHPGGYDADDAPVGPIWQTQQRRNLALARRGPAHSQTSIAPFLLRARVDNPTDPPRTPHACASSASNAALPTADGVDLALLTPEPTERPRDPQHTSRRGGAPISTPRPSISSPTTKAL